MAANRPYFSDYSKSERGNALVYVLIVIALFAAIGFALSRQSDTAESGTVNEKQAGISATQLQETAMQVKQALDQMSYTGSSIADLDFTRPQDGTFDDDPRIHKVFHPDGGGITLPRVAITPANSAVTDPVPGWYLGRFNNVEWSATTDTDVILTAYGIPEGVCAQINKTLTGDATINTASSPANMLVASAGNHSGTNADLTVADCAACEDRPSLCVKDAGANVWVFYSIMAQR